MGDDTDKWKTMSFSSWEICMTSLMLCVSATMLLQFLIPQFVLTLIDMAHMGDETSPYVACFGTIKLLVIMALSFFPIFICYFLCQYLINFWSGTKMVEPMKEFYTPESLKIRTAYQTCRGVITIIIVAGLAAVSLSLSLLSSAREYIKDSNNAAALKFILVCKALGIVFWVLSTILHVCNLYSLTSRSIISSEDECAV